MSRTRLRRHGQHPLVRVASEPPAVPGDAAAIGRFLASHGLTLTAAADGFTLTDLQAGTSYYHGSSKGLAQAEMVLAAAHCVLDMRSALRTARRCARA